jgi:hypothetical protein
MNLLLTLLHSFNMHVYASGEEGIGQLLLLEELL